MAKTATTVVGALGPSDTFVTLANQAALKAGDDIVCESEAMKALVVGTNAAIVYRGSRGTAGAAHAGGVAASYGPPVDFGPGTGVA